MAKPVTHIALKGRPNYEIKIIGNSKYHIHTIEFDGHLYEELRNSSNSRMAIVNGKLRMILPIPPYYITREKIDGGLGKEKGLDPRAATFDYGVISVLTPHTALPTYMKKLSQFVTENLNQLTKQVGVLYDGDISDISELMQRRAEGANIDPISAINCKSFWFVFRQHDGTEILAYLNPDLHKMFQQRYKTSKTYRVGADSWLAMFNAIHKKTRNLPDTLFDIVGLKTGNDDIDKDLKESITQEALSEWFPDGNQEWLGETRLSYGCHIFYKSGEYDDRENHKWVPLQLLSPDYSRITPDTLKKIQRKIKESLIDFLLEGKKGYSNSFYMYLAYPQSYLINVIFLNPLNTATRLYYHSFENSIDFMAYTQYSERGMLSKIKFPLYLNQDKLETSETESPSPRDAAGAGATVQQGGGILSDEILVNYATEPNKTIHAIFFNKTRNVFVYRRYVLMYVPKKLEVVERDGIVTSVNLNSVSYTKVPFTYGDRELFICDNPHATHNMYHIDTEGQIDTLDRNSENYKVCKFYFGGLPNYIYKPDSTAVRAYYTRLVFNPTLPIRVNGRRYTIHNPIHDKDSKGHPYPKSFYDDIKRNRNPRVKLDPTSKRVTVNGKTFVWEEMVDLAADLAEYKQHILYEESGDTTKQIIDVHHLLTLPNERVRSIIEALFPIVSPNRSDASLATMTDLSYLKRHRLFFHTYTDFNTSLLHLHNVVWTWRGSQLYALREVGRKQLYSIPLHFLMVNLDSIGLGPDKIGPDFPAIRVGFPLSKSYLMMHLDQLPVQGGGKIRPDFKPINSTKEDVLNLWNTKITQYTEKKININFFDKYPNNTVRNEIVIIKYLNIYNNRLHITHDIANRTRLHNLIELTFMFLDNSLALEIDKGYDCIYFNPLKLELGMLLVAKNIINPYNIFYIINILNFFIFA